METFKTYLILGLICFSVALIRYMPELYHLDFGTVSREILEEILDALLVAILISLLIGHLIEKASYEKIKE
ncbi:MAG: hypothetical protein L0287_26965, partial [Anaerolineae bacterium]|nr:hypothetical protein [Anaerolineae bacterium]